LKRRPPNGNLSFERAVTYVSDAKHNVGFRGRETAGYTGLLNRLGATESFWWVYNVGRRRTP